MRLLSLHPFFAPLFQTQNMRSKLNARKVGSEDSNYSTHQQQSNSMPGKLKEKERRGTSVMSRKINSMINNIVLPMGADVHLLPTKTIFFFTEEDSLKSLFWSVKQDFPSMLQDKKLFMEGMSKMFDETTTVSTSFLPFNEDSSSFSSNPTPQTCDNGSSVQFQLKRDCSIMPKHIQSLLSWCTSDITNEPCYRARKKAKASK